jgi:hypothetical protein
MRSGEHLRVIGKTEIIIGTEIDDWSRFAPIAD